MNYSIQYSQDASNDLRQIMRDIFAVSKDAKISSNYVKGILDKIDILTNAPFIGSMIDDKALVNLNIRYLLFKKYIIFYRVNRATNKVFIVRILNQKQNYSLLLKISE